MALQLFPPALAVEARGPDGLAPVAVVAQQGGDDLMPFSVLEGGPGPGIQKTGRTGGDLPASYMVCQKFLSLRPAPTGGERGLG
jgi:hypothetical protein